MLAKTMEIGLRIRTNPALAILDLHEWVVNGTEPTARVKHPRYQLPFGEPAFRIGCLVALAGAGAISALYGVARKAGASAWASAAGVLLYGLSYTYWSQSVRVEVYSFHVLLAALALFFALRYRESGRFGDLGWRKGWRSCAR